MSGKTQLAAERSKMTRALASMEKSQNRRTEDVCLRCGHARKEHIQEMFRENGEVVFGIRWTCFQFFGGIPYVLCPGFEGGSGSEAKG